MPGWLEQTTGFLLAALVLLDVFLVVLYARLGTGILARRISRMIWRAFLCVSRPMGRHRGVAMSFCGPVIVGVLVVTWALGLTLGTALVLHPVLGTAVRANSGPTPTDFVTAMYVGGSSLSIVGGGNFSPQTGAFKFFFLFNSLLGVSVLSLTLTYLMQIYSALQRRNALGLRMYLFSAQREDAAELIVRLGPRGQFQSGYANLSELSGAVAAMKETHHFYPVLFYFRFPVTYYSVSSISTVALDAVSLILSALDEREFGWLQESGAVTELWAASRLVITSLAATFLSGRAIDPVPPSAEASERWGRRYRLALRRLQQAGIRTVSDEQAGARHYVALRAEWDGTVGQLASALAYTREEIDPAGTNPERMMKEPPPPPELAREPFPERPHDGPGEGPGPLH
jgi:hypothetical protein